MRKLFNKSFGSALFLVGIFLCGAGLYVLFSPSHYQAMVRIIVQPDAGVASSQNSQAPDYDPYVVKTTLGIILSPLVLSNVVQTLNLNDAWGKKFAEGKQLTTPETIELLKRHISHVPIHHTMLIEIWVFSDDPDEAAKIANQVADSLQKHCLELARQKGSTVTNNSPVQIVDLAVPPQTLSPSISVRVVGVFLFIIGLLQVFGGFKILKSSARQSLDANAAL